MEAKIFFPLKKREREGGKRNTLKKSENKCPEIL